jgi:hypothetical protein
MDGRVNGGLNLSRAIGDHGYKMNKDLPPEEQMITALPDLKKIVLEPEDDFMVRKRNTNFFLNHFVNATSSLLGPGL